MTTVQSPGSLTRASPFSFACGRCSRCCFHKGIAVNPYEVLRLARNQGLSTTEFIRRHTESAGTLLRQRADGGCVFLTAQGCGVHADRPLVCRIYPLGRHISAEDKETFSQIKPHPESEGRYGTEGTAGDYLESQGAGEYLKAVDLYLKLYRELAGRFLDAAEHLAPAEREMADQRIGRPPEATAPGPAWLDVDHAVGLYCRERSPAKPADSWRLLELHLEALSSWSNDLGGKGKP